MYINEEDIIEEAKFRSFGCTAAIASAEALVELILNKNISEVQNIKNKDIVSFLDGLPDLKLHCSVLGEDVLIDALKNYSSIKSDTDDTKIICKCNNISKLSFEKTIVQCDNLCMAEIKKRLNFEFICGRCANSIYLLLAMYQEQQDTKNENHIS